LDNLTVRPGATVHFTATATDADIPANPLTFTLGAGAPTGASLDPATGEFTWTPVDTGSYPLTIRVNDGELEDHGTFTITVNNHAPTANAGVDQTVETGDTVTLDGSGSSDPDGDALTYEWTQTGGTAVTLSDIRAIQPTFTASETGILTFTLTVTDSWGLAATMPDMVQITVTETVYKVFLPLIMK
ncbi:MAG: putative Ig domain-containing protein, partial [Anaerolineae bacterium]|nr:putative Ig domain-containing protein [Anaerolineae bacterium]